MENYPEGCGRTVLKISQYPLPVETLRRMVAECDEILVLEDGQPFVEEQLRGLLDESGKDQRPHEPASCPVRAS